MNNYIENGTIIDYNHKILKENLHGVDLNDLSVQICSINLWLRALEKDKKLEKLSKNILHGNSLISGVESKEELAKYKNELKEIAKLREEIKNYYGRELSRKERDLLEGMEDELLRVRLEINSEINENLKEYFKNLDLIYPFNWEVEFTEVFDNPEEKQGFDVVIGNPPYVRQEKLNEVKHFFLDYYKGYNAVADLYVPFIEKSIILLRKKGMMSFIIPNKWLRAGYGRTLRKFILDNCKILNIIDFDGIKVFEDSTVDSSIIILQKEGNKKGNKIKVCEIKEKLGSEKEILNYIENNSFDFNQDELSENEWSFFKTEINEIRKRIFNESKTLKEYVKDKFNLYPPAYRGVTTGSNETYVISEEIKNKLVNKQNKHLFVPVIRGENLRRWSINYKNEYLLLITEDTDINKHPEVKKYLETKKDLLKKRWEVKKNKIKWYELRPCSYYDLLARKDKIIYCDISETNPFNYDKRGYYIVNTAYAIPVDDPYLLGLLNSRLMLFAFTSFAQKLGGKGYRFIYEFIERLPIHYPNKQEEAKLKNKVIILVNLTENKDEIINKFTQSLNNQTISDEKACKFEHYWNYSDLYDFSKETMNKINVVAAKILNMEIMEEDEKLILTITNYNEKQKKTYKNVQALRMNIKNKTLKKFLYFNIKKYINEKKGRGFGSGIILESIKKIQIPVYIVTCKRNLEKIKKVMDEFNHETKDLWKIDSKKYKSLSEIEDDIEKTDREIDEMVYDLYGITGEEKKIIEDSLK